MIINLSPSGIAQRNVSLADIDRIEKDIMSEAVKKWNNRTMNDLGPLLDETKDPSVLFRHNWLGRGQAFGLVASAGVGKSSMADQMALHWAVGDAFLAEPLRPLKIAVIQAEDSDRDLQEQREGMIKGLMSEGWSRDKIERAITGVVFPDDFISYTGESFIKLLTDYQSENKMDLIIINPLQRFFGKDISNQEDVSWFCSQMDGILKHKDYGCAAGIVMHTPKFHSGARDGRQSVDDYAEYAMAGSQEWTAWIRAVINFQKHGKSEDYFDIKASKRGKRLGWKNEDGEPITKRVFRHSDGFIYWQEVTDPEEIASIPESTPKKRETKEQFDPKKCALQIARQLALEYGTKSKSPKCKNQLKSIVYSIIQKYGHSKISANVTVEEIFENPADYGVRVVRHPKYSGETLELEEVV